MSENGRSRRNGGFDGDTAQNQTHQKKQDEEAQLEKIWQELENSEEGEEIDPERFLRDMAVLDELVPLPDFDLGASWQEFKEKHHALLEGLKPADQQSSAFASEEKPKRKRSVKPVRASLVVVLILAMVTMASCGIIEYIMKAIANWSDQVFRYEVTQELRVEEPGLDIPENQHYDSLEEALDACGVTTEYARVQFPDGYAFSDVRIRMHSDAIKLVASYVCAEDELLFTIWHYKDSTSLELQAAEKLPPDAEVYGRNGIEFYILENSDSTTITWISGTEMYRIFGPISATQCKQMIDSVYER
ncbi:MAG: hypothetical protein IKB65_00530 [Ruminiclostridium sp.]|nr:hypothetical protein [Ruminiclostridium sp.]